MRLGDLDALKEVIKANHYLLSAKNNSTDYGMFTTGIMQAIDNAPTVELDESVIQEVLNKRCMTVVTNEYLVALHGTRPQGDLISREALRERIDDCEYFNSSFQKMTVAEFLTIIYDIINKEAEDGES